MAQRILNSYRDINYSKASNTKMQINSYVARALGVITLPRYQPSQCPWASEWLLAADSAASGGQEAPFPQMVNWSDASDLGKLGQQSCLNGILFFNLTSKAAFY